jgi:predicted HicB family RNase H-like nuclease
MKDVIKYKNFIGSVRYSAEDKTFHGKIEGISDLMTFEGASVNELNGAFHEAVEDYIAICRKEGKAPQKSFKGSFNIRITPELHQKAAAKAAIKGISLNRFVQKAVEKEVQ